MDIQFPIRTRLFSQWIYCLLAFVGSLPAFAQLQPLAPQASAPQPQWELWRINPDGTGLARFADTPGYSCGSPKFSPDGSHVAYDTRPIKQDLFASQVAVVRADGTDLRLLSPGSMPSWSPDGKQLVFHTYRPSAIVVMNADGSGRETLTDHFGAPRWLATGDRIALIGRSRGITILDLATGVERESSLNILASVRPGFAVSNDGLRYVFGNDGDGLFLSTLDPKSAHSSVSVLWRGSGNFYHADFSPDGKQIVFGWQLDRLDSSSELPLHQLYLLDLDTNGPPVPLPGQDTTRNNTNPDWSPDGKTIIFASQEPSTDQVPTP